MMVLRDAIQQSYTMNSSITLLDYLNYTCIIPEIYPIYFYIHVAALARDVCLFSFTAQKCGVKPIIIT